MGFPRVVLAGVKSGVGKTTISLGVMRALKEDGMEVKPFKVGPDYIDTGLHRIAAGHYSHNLDGWMGTPEVVRSIFFKNAYRARISIIEGVMGLFDGSREGDLCGSTAQVATLLDAPVILVVNVQGMGKSCVPLVKGFNEYLPSLRLAGVILNGAGGDFQQKRLPGLIEGELGIEVLGVIPRIKEMSLPERHLGLVPAQENPGLEGAISSMAKTVRAGVDLEKLVKLADKAPDFIMTEREDAVSSIPVKVGVAMDEAFNFYYQESLDYLEEWGAELYYFSPLWDTALPPVDGLYLGGGFPEMFLERLASNKPMKRAVAEAAKKDMPLLAECGGFMYLAETIKDLAGKIFPGVGVVPAHVEMTERLQALGYIKATACRDTLLAARGVILRGHEFHYSRVKWINEPPSAFTLTGGRGPDHRREGYAYKNLQASYLHLHLRSHPEAVRRFLSSCRSFSQKGEGSCELP